MIAKQDTAIRFEAFFTKFGEGVVGLTPTIKVAKDSVRIVNDASMSAATNMPGLYYYSLAAGSNDAKALYTGIAASTGDVDAPHIPCAWVVGPVEDTPDVVWRTAIPITTQPVDSAADYLQRSVGGATSTLRLIKTSTDLQDGTTSSGTDANIDEEDGVTWDIDDGTVGFDLRVTFSAANMAQIMEFQWKASLVGHNNDFCVIQAWHPVDLAWDDISTPGTQLNPNAGYLFNRNPISTSYVAGDDTVLVRFYGSMRSAAVLSLDFVGILASTDSGYVLTASEVAEATAAKMLTATYGGIIYLDTVEGQDRDPVTLGEDGTSRYPVKTLAQAKIIADAVGSQVIHVYRVSSITLSSALGAYTLQNPFAAFNDRWIMALNGQDVSDSIIAGADISGTYLAASGQPSFVDCTVLDAGITGPPALFYQPVIKGPITMNAGGVLIIVQSSQTETWANAGVIDFGAVGNVNLYVSDNSGPLVLKGMATNDTAEITGGGTLTLDVSCTGGVVKVEGNYQITDNAGGAVTLVDDSNYDRLLHIPEQTADMDANSVQLARLDADISSRLASNDIRLDRLDENISNRASQASVDNLENLSVAEVWDRVLTGATHNIVNSAGRRLRQLQDTGVYQDGAVWISTVHGSPGTELYTNGTVFNPVDNIADALTIAAGLNLHRFVVLPESVIVLPSGVDDFIFQGYGYSIDLNGQSVSGTAFVHATILGNDDGLNTAPTYYEQCLMGSNQLGHHNLMNCQLSGDIVLHQVGDYFWDSCFSGVAGTGSPSVDFQSAAEIKNLSIRHYSGGMEYKNFGAGGGTHTSSYEGMGQLILNANCAGGTIAVRGAFDITDNSGGSVTISQDANFEKGVLIPAQTADIDANSTKLDVAVGTRATQASVDLIPTNPLLTNDVRLDYLDAPISGVATPGDVPTSEANAIALLQKGIAGLETAADQFSTARAVAFLLGSKVDANTDEIIVRKADGTEWFRLAATFDPTAEAITGINYP